MKNLLTSFMNLFFPKILSKYFCSDSRVLEVNIDQLDGAHNWETEQLLYYWYRIMHHEPHGKCVVDLSPNTERTEVVLSRPTCVDSPERIYVNLKTMEQSEEGLPYRCISVK